MAELLGRAVLELTTDDTGLDSGISRAKRSAENIGKRFTSVGKTMSLALTAPLVLFGQQAVKAATDAEELQSAFDFSFGKMARSMNDWATATGDSLGRSTQLIQEQAFQFNQLFKSAVDPEQAAQMSQQFTMLANDLSSFFNVTETDALQKLRSGLIGESEPLRAFGVFLSAGAVEAKAFELGIGRVGEKLTEQQKIMARAALIMEATKDAQGDLARTSESNANKQRALGSAWEELSVKLGTMVNQVMPPVLEALTSMLGWFTELSPSTQKWILIIGGAAAVLGPVALGIGGLVGGLASLAGGITTLLPIIATASKALMGLVVATGPIGLLIAAVGAVVAIWANWDTIGPMLENLYTAAKTWLQDRLGVVLDWVGSKVDAVTGFFGDMYTAVVGNSYVPDMVNGIAEQFGRLPGVMVGPAGAAVGQTVGIYRDGMMQISEFAQLGMDAQKGALVEGLGQSLAAMGDHSKKAFKLNKAFALSQAVVSTAQGVAQALRDVPWPLNLAAAAMVAAQGVAQIATIKSQSFTGGGGGGGSSFGGGAGGGSVPQQAQIAPPPVVSAEERNQSRIEVRVTGTDELGRAMANSIQVVTNDEDSTLFGRNSRQALEVA